ncbi:hypothetical protein Bbelb_056790 [Branchiostoma belcheri]|nr:hypothetical protein Bbelb_056790 [Branchiostoma belcheri]
MSSARTDHRYVRDREAPANRCVALLRWISPISDGAGVTGCEVFLRQLPQLYLVALLVFQACERPQLRPDASTHHHDVSHTYIHYKPHLYNPPSYAIARLLITSSPRICRYRFPFFLAR